MNYISLRELSINITDGVHSTVIDDKNGNSYLLSCKNIKNNKVIYDESDRKINIDTLYNLRSRTKTAKNDILLTTVGTIGETAIIKDENPNYEFQRSVGIIKIDSSKINPYYVYYYLQSNHAQKVILSKTKGAVQKCLFLEDIRMLEIPIVNNESQQHIVDTIGSIDDLIENYTTINELVEKTINNTFINSYLNWKIKSTIGKEFNCLLGGTPSTSNPEYWDGNVNWINSGEINNFRISKPSRYITELGMNKSATKLLKKGTSVIAITGATLGQVSLLEIDSCANQSVIGICESKYKKDYIYPLMNYSIKQLMLNQTGGAQQHINKNDVESFEINLPNEIEYEIYSNKVMPLIDMQSYYVKIIDNLIKLKENYLNKFFN